MELLSGFNWWPEGGINSMDVTTVAVTILTARNVQVSGGTGPNGFECCGEANDTERRT